jgi:hypothetical protein
MITEAYQAGGAKGPKLHPKLKALPRVSAGFLVEVPLGSGAAYRT